MNRIVNTALAGVAVAGALALAAEPVMAQTHYSGGTRSGGYRGSYSGGYRGGYSGGYRGGYGYRGYRGGYGGFGLGLSFGWPGYYGYGYGYPYYGGCTVWSPYYGRYVVRPGCYDYDYYGY
jgi:hypothetical protein